MDWPSRAVTLFSVTALLILSFPPGQALAPVPLQLFPLNGNFDQGDMAWTVRGNARIENGKALIGDTILVAPCLFGKPRAGEVGGIRTDVPIPTALGFTKLKYDLRFRSAPFYTGDYLEVRIITENNAVAVIDHYGFGGLNGTCPWFRLPRTVALPPVAGLTYAIDFRFVDNGDYRRVAMELDNIVLS